MASPGSYKGTTINAGTDAEVAAQMAAIDSAGKGGSSGGKSSAGGNNKGSGSGGNGGGNALMSEIEKKLLSQSDLISSTNTELEDKISQAIGGVQKASEASAARTESEFGREIGYRIDKGEIERIGVNEASAGYSRQTALLRLMDERTDKDLKDLEMRKNELLLQGESDAASTIAGLQMEALKFRQDANQNMFNNLLGMGSYANTVRQTNLDFQREARQADEFKLGQALEREKFAFQKATTLEEQRMSQIRINIAEAELKLKDTEYGLIPDEGFANVSVQNKIGSAANTELMGIQARKDAGELTTPEEEEAATIQSYMKIRREASKSQVSDDALARVFGLNFDESGELGLVGVDSVSNIPGDEGNLFDIIGQLYSDGGIGLGLRAPNSPFGPAGSAAYEAFR